MFIIICSRNQFDTFLYNSAIPVQPMSFGRLGGRQRSMLSIYLLILECMDEITPPSPVALARSSYDNLAYIYIVISDQAFYHTRPKHISKGDTTDTAKDYEYLDTPYHIVFNDPTGVSSPKGQAEMKS